jgi:hypothetical protein
MSTALKSGKGHHPVHGVGSGWTHLAGVAVPRAGRVWIGTSGWNYRHWRGLFYPPELPQRQELAHLGRRLGSVEVNGTFYSLTRPSVCAAWRRAVPPDFVFAIKAWIAGLNACG